MKRLPIIALFFAIIAITVASCASSTSSWDEYMEWQKENTTWYNTQKALKNADGSDFYKPLKPNWYPMSGVLIHYFNDTNLTAGNLVPMISSTVKVKYKGELYNGAAFDSSYAEVDSTRTFTISDGLIAGWQIALTHMHVGDSCRVIIPYAQGYGTEGSGTIAPFSTLSFDIKLVDITAYEIRPE